MELASRFVTAPIVLIGGTNGKSTTTALTGAMLEAAGRRTFVGGNFGTPLSEVVDASWDALVLEISSFQAERVPTLHARAHALLNITDDHLDRYASFAAYADAKGNPFVNMTAEDTAILPFGDALVAGQAARGAARVVTFSAHDAAADIAVRGERIEHRPLGWSLPLSLLRIAGAHNVANACAAIGLAASLGAGRAPSPRPSPRSPASITAPSSPARSTESATTTTPRAPTWARRSPRSAASPSRAASSSPAAATSSAPTSPSATRCATAAAPSS